MAGGDRRLAFVQKLSQLTGAGIAASTTLTGSREQGGNWDFASKTRQFPLLVFRSVTLTIISLLL